MLGRSIDLFESAFRSHETPSLFLLPKITTLVVSSSAMFLARHCPNLRTLLVRDAGDCSIEAYSDLDTRLFPLRPTFSAGNLPGTSLTAFDAPAVWSQSELMFLTTHFPHLTHLVLRSDTYCYRASVRCIMSLLGQTLRGLKVLRLSGIQKLDMGYRSVWKRRIQECKTEEGRLWLWKVDEEARVDRENEVVRMAFREVEGLRECWIGEKRVARRVVGGEMRWMWERWKEDVDHAGLSALWAKYRVEREAVVVCREEGT